MSGEKLISLGIDPELHRRMKAEAIEQDRNVKELYAEAAVALLGKCTAKRQEQIMPAPTGQEDEGF